MDEPDGAPCGELSDAERHALAEGDDVALMLAVARRYYHGDQSKVTIAKALGFSRFQVARMLQEARRDGLVRIEIGSPGRVDREMSAALQDTLGIARAVVVVSGSSSPQSTVEHLGRALAQQVTSCVHEGDRIGVAWGVAAVAMAQSLEDLRRCTVVQLAGAIYPPPGVMGSVELARRVAAAAGGEAHAIYAPLVVADAETAEGLRRQPEIASVLDRMRALDAAVLAVGAWRPSASAVHDLLGPDEQQELARAGVCGEISGRLFDHDGTILDTPLDDRVIGIGAHRLREVPHLITSSHGAYRADATLAAVRAGLVHTLVADDELATALLG